MDVVVDEFVDDAFEGFLVGNAYQDDRRGFVVEALGESGSHRVGCVAGLDDLLGR